MSLYLRVMMRLPYSLRSWLPKSSKTDQDLVSEPKNTDEAITAEIKMGLKVRKTTTDAVVEILVVPCSRGGLWRGEETRGMRRGIEPVV
ncbi:hypothetical protein YC2023_032283 [Brassica napus]